MTLDSSYSITKYRRMMQWTGLIDGAREWIAILTLVILATMTLTTTAFSAPLITHQGYLTTDQGAPLPGPVDLTFGIYVAASGGDPLWSEVHSDVSLANGTYAVLLGSVTAFPADLFAADSLWIQTSVDGTTLPRRIIGDVPRAIEAAHAVVADSVAGWSGVPGQYWEAVGSDIYNTNSGNVGIGTSAPVTALHVPGRGIQIGTSATATDNFHMTASEVAAHSGLRFWNGNHGTGAHLMTLTSGGNLGIGTWSDPTARLQVEGLSTFHRDDWGNVTILLQGQKQGPPNNWGEYGIVASYTGVDINNTQTSANLLHLGAGGGTSANSYINATGGNLGVGTAAPDEKLTVAGVVRSTSGGFMFPDGSVQTTAQVQGPQGLPGPQGPPGPQGDVAVVFAGNREPDQAPQAIGRLWIDWRGHPEDPWYWDVYMSVSTTHGVDGWQLFIPGIWIEEGMDGRDRDRRAAKSGRRADTR